MLGKPSLERPHSYAKDSFLDRDGFADVGGTDAVVLSEDGYPRVSRIAHEQSPPLAAIISYCFPEGRPL